MILKKHITTFLFLASFIFHSFSQSNDFQIVIQGFEPRMTNSYEDLLKWVQVVSNNSGNGKVELQLALNHADGENICTFQAVGEVKQGITPGSSLEVRNKRTTDDSFSEIIQQTGALPEGNYLLCISSLNHSFETNCETYRFRNTAMLELTFPFNKEEVELERPYFSWVYGQFNSFTRFNITCKELKEGQSEIEALERNPLLFYVENHSSLFLTYPNEIDPIETGKNYVWQVDVLVEGRPIGKSEIWSFYRKEAEEVISYPISRSYVEINELNEPPSLYILDELKIKTSHKSKSGEIQVSIFNEKNKKEKLSEHNVLFSDVGENYFILKLDDIANLKHLKKYRCEFHSELLDQQNVTIFFTYLDPGIVKD